MSRYISYPNLLTFVQKASSTNTAYFRKRRELFELFASLIRIQRIAPDGECRVTGDQYASLVSFLSARNDQIKDDSKLSYLKTIDELIESLQQEAIPNLEDDDEHHSVQSAQT